MPSNSPGFSTELQDYDHIVVVGLGITGLSVVEHLCTYAKHADVKVIDTREIAPGSEHLDDDIELFCGGWNTTWLQQADLVICSPGIAVATPEIATVIELGTPVIGDIELFAWQVTKPVIAITGSNGKSTVTDLTGELAKAAGINVGVGGNIGTPALSLLQQNCDLYVLELSSFQLETTYHLAPKVATFLNLSEDHMDRYEGMEDYRQAKLRIFEHAEQALVNGDEPETAPVPSHSLKLHRFSPIHTLGDTDYDIKVVDGEARFRLQRKTSFLTRQLSIVGRHNQSNALVALALLDLAGIDTTQCEGALQSYTGLSHRCQVVEHQKGVRWVNDSKATNVASTQAALSGLEVEGRLYLLVGGDGKGADFTPLKEHLAQLAVTLCCFGRDGDAFMELSNDCVRFQTMEQAIETISTKLTSGDMVMLSPACASFDQYPNFMRRGDAFIALAKQYA
ncbi:UDP-N-acetylmuramoyl-L-alanine--D-glutamate ligase [Vibrio ulleungensis]|uniref:UDP-N-acetylmuramoylalanine--D-glutamate ligase n=1 Tax=Vibrio ulleungensis TaxID=2807619 RepID=A0ABS2HIY4_9VIBR|nr:UDP-N-acetylmuramoyl-L-alanine--D-glutamate ligase [Vibrio ulleungensis]MBM7037490.1 UDP-N-acetylmuramoyl-L-alanine--D-glutamate ligase [Vibrio ulleungensis]